MKCMCGVNLRDITVTMSFSMIVRCTDEPKSNLIEVCKRTMREKFIRTWMHMGMSKYWNPKGEKLMTTTNVLELRGSITMNK